MKKLMRAVAITLILCVAYGSLSGCSAGQTSDKNKPSDQERKKITAGDIVKGAAIAIIPGAGILCLLMSLK